MTYDILLAKKEKRKEIKDDLRCLVHCTQESGYI